MVDNVVYAGGTSSVLLQALPCHIVSRYALHSTVAKIGQSTLHAGKLAHTASAQGKEGVGIEGIAGDGAVGWEAAGLGR